MDSRENLITGFGRHRGTILVIDMRDSKYQLGGSSLLDFGQLTHNREKSTSMENGEKKDRGGG